MVRIKDFFRQQRPVVVLIAVVLLLTTIPVIETFFIIGDSWRGILPPLTEGMYEGRIQTIGEGHLTSGNPYYLEHVDGPPLVLFGGAWINALPLFMGFSLPTAMFVNFVIWSLLFAASVYWLLRELRTPSWGAVFGTVFLYIQSYGHVLRPVNLQTVYPFYFLFYVALFRFIREQNRKNTIFLALVTGATFYIYAYLWQIVVITLGLLFLHALVQKNWSLLKATFTTSCLGVAIGLPVPLYALWLSHSSPYFWESVERLGLVNTHLPMAEVIYSGGWIGVLCILVGILYWRVHVLRANREFTLLAVFIVVSGFGMWVMEGSNLITGKLLETGEHMPGFIFPWLAFCAIGLGVFLWRQRAQLSGWLRVISIAVLLTFVSISIDFVSLGIFTAPNTTVWQEQQLYAKPFLWLQNNEKDSVVVWSDPHETLATFLPIYTRHFMLDAVWGLFELVPDGEIRERYLVSQYFNKPTIPDFKRDMALYLGRKDTVHAAKTIERGVKICRILFLWDSKKDCGAIPTSESLLGDQFFIDLENRFKTDIEPNIKAYLKKYHVAYILKDTVLNQDYHPGTLGAVRVYGDTRFELYKMQY